MSHGLIWLPLLVVFPLITALGWLEREQHTDGTIDLPTTNFHSPPDTAFVVIDLVPLYRLLQRDGSSEARGWLPRLESFLRRAAGAIATGGIHTPNHRWVASASVFCLIVLPKKGSMLLWVNFSTGMVTPASRLCTPAG